MGNFIFITGVVSLLAGVLIFLFAFRVIKPLIKTEEKKGKYDSWMNKHSHTAKGFAFILAFFGIITVIQNNPDQTNSITTTSSTPGRNWTESDKQSLTNECVRMYISQEQIPDSDIDLAENYCSCTTEKMTDEFTITDLMAHDTLSQMEKVNLYEPVVENCLTDLEYQLNERYDAEL